jgi:hypothetical protein
MTSGAFLSEPEHAPGRSAAAAKRRLPLLWRPSLGVLTLLNGVAFLPVPLLQGALFLLMLSLQPLELILLLCGAGGLLFVLMTSLKLCPLGGVPRVELRSFFRVPRVQLSRIHTLRVGMWSALRRRSGLDCRRRRRRGTCRGRLAWLGLSSRRVGCRLRDLPRRRLSLSL